MNKNYTALALFGFVLWIAETDYFGWNATAQSTAESILDTISWLLIVWGIVGDIVANLEIHKHYNIENAECVEIKTEGDFVNQGHMTTPSPTKE